MLDVYVLVESFKWLRCVNVCAYYWILLQLSLNPIWRVLIALSSYRLS